MTVREQLKQKGYLVTHVKYGGWDNVKRMITDLNKKEIGFYSPLEAIKKLCNEKTS
jgi:hypothetical protein